MANSGARPVSQDAVVVVPGIMGSSLRDTTTGDLIWGLDDLRWYWRAWTRRDGLRALAVAQDEPSGRVVPEGLLRFPAWAPFLGGFEPYTKLVKALRATAADPAAVLEFAYDWRLPVEHNARLLAAAMARHLEQWRRAPAQATARRQDPDGRPAQLVLVAHSMGGLLAQALNLIPGATEDVRTTITLGTPFYGAVKAALILNTGRGTPLPLPRKRLRATARTMPGLHDLLPTYRCVHTGPDAVFLEPAAVHDLGGDLDLAKRSRDFHRRLDQSPLVGHHSLVGVAQKTAQGLVIRDGEVTGVRAAFGHTPDGTLEKRDFAGDGTVYWESAAKVEGYHRVAQQHGALPSTDEAISLVRELFLRPGGRPRPLLGDTALGIDVPDVVDAGAEFAVTLTDVRARVAVYEATGDRPTEPVHVGSPSWEDGAARVRVVLDRPGLYRVDVAGSGATPVTQTVLVDG